MKLYGVIGVFDQDEPLSVAEFDAEKTECGFVAHDGMNRIDVNSDGHSAYSQYYFTREEAQEEAKRIALQRTIRCANQSRRG